jgi:hypothetical protein
VHDWRRNQAALMVASFVGFTGFTLVMPFLALRFQAPASPTRATWRCGPASRWA